MEPQNIENKKERRKIYQDNYNRLNKGIKIKIAKKQEKNQGNDTITIKNFY